MKPEFDFSALKESDLIKELVLQVRKTIGPFAVRLRWLVNFHAFTDTICMFNLQAPKGIHLVPDLPKTRSGKIMRRILRKIVAGESDQLGDLSTLADPSVVEEIKKKVEKKM
jgi:acetyl-CoA synthetase